MQDNNFQAQYDLTKKSKIKKFYESNKIFIFSSLLILVILFGSFSFYFSNKVYERNTHSIYSSSGFPTVLIL